MAVFAAAPLLLSAACRADHKPATKEAVIWHGIGSWSGHGNGQTGSFSVETGALRLQWETRNENPAGTGTFRVSLHSAISGRPLQVAVDQRGAGRDTTYLEDDPRVSYLVVESANLDWTLNLEEAVQGLSEPDAGKH